MWDYTDKVRDHYLNPRNVGEIENPDGYGEIGNIKCGDAMRLTFKLDHTGKIEDIRVKTFGCGSAIASSSVLTEMCMGKTVEEASQITNDQIAMELGGLPAAKMHCSVMGQEALEAAIDFYRNGGKSVAKEEKSRVVCHCFNVTEETIVSQIRQNGLTTVEQVTNYTKAGGGCGACLEEIEEILQRVNNEMDAEHDHDHGDSDEEHIDEGPTLTMLQKVDRVRTVLNEEIRPALQRDHGDCELIDIEGDNVKIKFIGSCASCAFSSHTQNDFIEATLKKRISSKITVSLV